ncbi:D-sedoheptulose-7-phosphate isomerase [Radicibacter daui]|uniref:D-sedoheptulose-7-phosphate isomerase n=1 Tax=Radicibacter daui TaxID=3064829 RepID=UPI004046F65B
MTSLFARNLSQHVELMSRLDALEGAVMQAASTVADTLRTGGKLMLCGNGGSAADSQHIAAEFTGRFIKDRKPLAAIALSTDSSALTCISNDYSFADVFARQLVALARAGDCLIGISTSGNSANVIRAVEAARELGVRSIGLLGRDGGKLAALCDEAIIVPSDVTARIQEAHILIGHTICGAAEQQLGLVPGEGA